MKIKYLAHAAFLITGDNGTRIVTDPYTYSPGMGCGAINETADIVTVSHEHGDHNNVAAIKGNPQVVKNSTKVKDIEFRAVTTAHDNTGGSQRGKNDLFCFTVDDVNLCHAGDLGHNLTAEQSKAIGKVDVLMIPVGGFFTIDAAIATKVCDQLKPRIILPMHYKAGKSDFPIAGVEDFLKGKNNVTRLNESELGVTASKLPSTPQIMVLKPSL